ncbi:hypothetical protein [Streptomyces sp. NPDC046942]|uniref:hypothetical protein n=1 Tax=Streptomyces sp. NPDC046942 TaxID=3155137 RepID=UPI0033C1CE80
MLAATDRRHPAAPGLTTQEANRAFVAPALLELQERDKDTAEIFIELTQQGLDRSPAADLWRSLVAVDLSFFKSSLAEELRDEGRAKAKVEAVLRLLDRRGVEIPDEARERVTSCDDLDLLNAWFDRAITATSASEVFTETE